MNDKQLEFIAQFNAQAGSDVIPLPIAGHEGNYRLPKYLRFLALGGGMAVAAAVFASVITCTFELPDKTVRVEEGMITVTTASDVVTLQNIEGDGCIYRRKDTEVIEQGGWEANAKCKKRARIMLQGACISSTGRDQTRHVRGTLYNLWRGRYFNIDTIEKVCSNAEMSL